MRSDEMLCSCKVPLVSHNLCAFCNEKVCGADGRVLCRSCGGSGSKHIHDTYVCKSVKDANPKCITERDLIFNLTLSAPPMKGNAWEEGSGPEFELCCIEEDMENGLIVPESFYGRIGVTAKVIEDVYVRASEEYEPDEPDPPEPMDRD